jgi:asparagine synthase (glutamine-hydrolysing)
MTAPEDWSDIPNQISQLLFDTWLVSNCLALGDRTSMASSLELRLPLLDHKLIELVVGLRKRQPDHGLGHKFWFKKALQGILPDEVLNRPKRGFEPPYGEWISALLKAYGELVLHGYLVKNSYFDKAFIEKLFKNYQRNYLLVYRLIFLEIWYRTIVLGEMIHVSQKNTLNRRERAGAV